MAAHMTDIELLVLLAILRFGDNACGVAVSREDCYVHAG